MLIEQLKELEEHGVLRRAANYWSANPDLTVPAAGRLLAAAEAAVALAIALNFYNNHDSIDVDRADQLQG